MSELIPISTPLRVFEDHEKSVRAVAVFPNKRRMVTGSDDKTLRLWDLETGVVLKKMEGHSGGVKALAVSRDGQIIASGDENGEVIAWHGESGESITQPIKAHSEWISSVDFSPDGTVLATGSYDHTVKFWCTKTWQMQGDPIECGNVHCVRYSPSGELRIAIGTKKSIQIYNPGTRECVASLTGRTHAWTPDGTRLLSVDLNLIHEWDTSTWQQVSHPYQHADKIRTIAINPAGTLVASGSNLWLLSDRQTIAVFQYSYSCVTFSVDGKHILGGSWDNKISKWEVPKNANAKILTMTTFRNACLTEDLSTAEELFTQEIDTDPNDFISYAHRSFVMTRKHDCDDALRDAMKSISIQPSLTGYISKGIALCGKGHVREARIALDVASMFTNQDSKINHFLLLIKAIILFNADQHEEAMLLIKELAAACSNADLLACRVVEAYLCVQLGTKALDNARYDEAADHFTAAVNSGAFLSAFIDQTCQDLVVLFGWDLESLCLTAHQKRCQAFLSASKPDEALQAHQCMMNAIDESTKASCLDWSNEFKERCSALAEQNDRILGAEIPGQGQDGYDTEPNFFHGRHQHSQISRPQPQQRHGRLKRLRNAMTRTPRSAPPPAPPTTSTPVNATTTLKKHLRRLFTLPPHRATLPVVDVSFAKGRLRNAAAGAPGSEHSLIRDEDYDGPPTPDPNTQQQPVVAQVDTGQHGRGRSCCCF